MFAERVPKNTIVISLGFFFVYSAFDSLTDIEESIIEGFKDEGHSFAGSGYYVLSVFSVSFALCAFITPVLMEVLGFKLSLFVSSIVFSLFMGSHIYPIAAIVYPLSVICGVFTSLLWSAGFALISVSCDLTYVALNATIFYFTAQFSYALGSLYIFTILYLDPDSADYISATSRVISTTSFTAFSLIGLGIFQLASVPTQYSRRPNIKNTRELTNVFTRAFTVGYQLMRDLNFLSICVIFLYTGLSQSFMTGVYSTSIAHTLTFNDYKVDSKAMLGLSGVALGCGEVTSGFFKVLLLSKTASIKRRMRLCLAAYIMFNLSHYLILLNLPDETPYEDSYNSAYLPTSPNPYLALFCSFLIGASDFIYQSELFATIGEIAGPNEAISCTATVFYSFLQGLGGMSAFLYAGNTGLLFQISILIALNFLSIFVFLFRDKRRQVEVKHDTRFVLETDTEVDSLPNL